MTKARIREIRAHAEKIETADLRRAMPHNPEAAIIMELATEIERLQTFTRCGQSPQEPEELPPAAKVKGPPDPNVKLFIDGWATAFQQFHHTKYMVQGAKDAAAAKRLVKDSTVDDLLDTAWEAWQHPDKFNCKQAATIAGFASRFNDIKIELKTLANGGRPQSTEAAQCRL